MGDVPHDRRVPQLGEHRRFAREALHVVVLRVLKHLHRGGATGVPVLRAVDAPHPAAPGEPFDFEAIGDDVRDFGHASKSQSIPLSRSIRARKLAAAATSTARSVSRMTKPILVPLKKARPLALVDVRPRLVLRTVDARWREAFDAADVVSEGAARDEPHSSGARVWYGSTSIIVRLGEAGRPLPESERAFLASIAERDVHARVRALRIAVREASARALAGLVGEAAGNVRLGRSQCEIRVSVDPEGVRIDVDVQAPLIEGSVRRASRRAT